LITGQLPVLPPWAAPPALPPPAPALVGAPLIPALPVLAPPAPALAGAPPVVVGAPAEAAPAVLPLPPCAGVPALPATFATLPLPAVATGLIGASDELQCKSPAESKSVMIVRGAKR